MRITWSPPTTGGAPTGYRIYRYTSNNSASASEIATSTATSYDDTSAVAGTTYWYWVKAYNGAGSSVSFSNGDSGYRKGPPGPPSGLSATDGAYGDRVRVTWVAPTTGATGYKVYRHTSNNSASATEIATTAATSYDDYAGNLNTYWYWVKAYNSAGTGSYSNGDSGYCQAMTLSVTKDDCGIVTGPGINCGYNGTDCNENYILGTSVTLTANADWPPCMFNTFYGCDSSSGNTCTVIMDHAKTVSTYYNIYAPP